jgi:hypothetical protein
MDAYGCVAVISSPYCSAWQLVPVGMHVDDESQEGDDN